MIILMLANCAIVCWLVVKPLVSYNKSIKLGEIFPVIGAAELQNLAITYNQVYLESQETEKLIRHEAEHDPLTDLLNRGSFDKLLRIYETGDSSFAMILVDVDTFKHVNDTYGHSIGDQILKKVAAILKTQFRSIDYVCRIGGDEFAIIMVEMTSDLQYTIQNKIDEANKELFNPTDGLPAVSLSVGVAFSDRKDPTGTIFNDADSALYYVKEHGRHACGFYGQQHEEDEETASVINDRNSEITRENKMELWDIYDSDKKRTGRTMKRNDWHLKDGEYHLTVLGVIHRPDGRFLITRRVMTKAWAPGWWEVSGGAVQAGEDSAVAVAREIREETGLDVSGCPDGYRFTYRRDNPGEGDNYFVDVYRFELDFNESDLKLQEEETMGYRLATLDEIKELDKQGIFLHYSSIQKVFE